MNNGSYNLSIPTIFHEYPRNLAGQFVREVSSMSISDGLHLSVKATLMTDYTALFRMFISGKALKCSRREQFVGSVVQISM